MDFFVYSRAAPSAAGVEHDPALDEEHWSYMDRFADGMIARGPTLAADRELWTGSIHIVDLPSADAAREFVEREPYNGAGLFEHHTIRRFENLLGRTMWESPGGSADPRFFVIAHRVPGAGDLLRRRCDPGNRRRRHRRQHLRDRRSRLRRTEVAVEPMGHRVRLRAGRARARARPDAGRVDGRAWI